MNSGLFVDCCVAAGEAVDICTVCVDNSVVMPGISVVY